MKPIILAVLLLLCCGEAFSSPVLASNQYVDTLIYNHLPYEASGNNVDPAKLGNFSAEQKDKVLLIPITVNMEYYDGEMTGMYKIKRAGDCTPIRRDYGNFTLNCTLVFKDISVTYNAKMKYGIMPKATVTAKGNMSSTYVFVEITTSQSRSAPFLKRINLSKTGSFSDDIIGLGLLNRRLARLVKAGFVSRVTSEFFNVYNYNFVPSFSRAVAHSVMPNFLV